MKNDYLARTIFKCTTAGMNVLNNRNIISLNKEFSL